MTNPITIKPASLCALVSYLVVNCPPDQLSKAISKVMRLKVVA